MDGITLLVRDVVRGEIILDLMNQATCGGGAERWHHLVSTTQCRLLRVAAKLRMPGRILEVILISRKIKPYLMQGFQYLDPMTSSINYRYVKYNVSVLPV